MSDLQFVPLCEPHLCGQEWAYVKDCLDTGWVSSAGPYVERLERLVCERVQVANAVATSSGTAALHLGLLALGVKPGEEVLVSSLTFIAPVNAIRYIGAWPVFIDSEPEFWQMDVAQVENFLSERCVWSQGGVVNRATGRRVSAILPVHILGHPVDLQPLVDLARRYDLVILEDATECLGAKYRGLPCGSIGHAGCFSFNGNKIVTTGGGGMLVTNSADLARRAKYLSTQAKDDPLEYIHGDIGYNYRLTNIQAALGCAQMEQLSSYIDAKRRIASEYRRALSGLPGVSPMRSAPWAESIEWMFTVRIDSQLTGVSSRELISRLRSASIQSRPLWQPAHLSPSQGDVPGQLATPVAEELNRDCVSLPCSVALSGPDQARVVDCVRSVCRLAGYA